MKDVKFFLVGLIGGVITLFLPVLLWNVWFLDYIDKHGKLIAFGLTPVFALVSALLFVGVADIHKRLVGPNDSEGHTTVNPFWGWAGVALVIEVVIVLLSNS